VVLRAYEVAAQLIAPYPAAGLPQIVPTVHGGIQLEWHRGGVDLEIEVAATGEVLVDYESADGSVCWDGDYADLQVEIAQVLRHSATQS
jgi:hypothetical protein